MLLYPLVQIITSMLGFAGNHSDAPLDIDFDSRRIKFSSSCSFDQPPHISDFELGLATH
jgi:hypothetical protein